MLNALALPPVRVRGAGRAITTRVNDVVNVSVPANINRDPGEWIRLTDEGEGTSGISVPGTYSATFLQKDQTEHPRPDIANAAYEVQGYKGLPTDQNPDPWSKTGLVVRAWRGEVVDRSGTQTQIWYFEYSRRGAWIRLTEEGDGDAGNRAVGEFEFVKLNDDQTAHTGMNRAHYAKEVNGGSGFKTDDDYPTGHIVWAWLGDVINDAGTMTEVWYFHHDNVGFWAELTNEGSTDGGSTAWEIPGRFSFAPLNADLSVPAFTGDATFAAYDANGAEGLPTSAVPRAKDPLSTAQGGKRTGLVVWMRFAEMELRGAVQTPIFVFEHSRRGGWFELLTEGKKDGLGGELDVPGNYTARPLDDDAVTVAGGAANIVLIENNSIRGLVDSLQNGPVIVWAEVAKYVVDPDDATNRILTFRFKHDLHHYMRLKKRDPANPGHYQAVFVDHDGNGNTNTLEFQVREANRRDWLDTDDLCGVGCGLVVLARTARDSTVIGAGPDNNVPYWTFEYRLGLQVVQVEESSAPTARGDKDTDAAITYNIYHECADIAVDPTIAVDLAPHRARLPKTTYVPGPDESFGLATLSPCGAVWTLLEVYKEIEDAMVFNCHHQCHCPPP
jgi:hypothetical protein